MRRAHALLTLEAPKDAARRSDDLFLLAAIPQMRDFFRERAAPFVERDIRDPPRGVLVDPVGTKSLVFAASRLGRVSDCDVPSLGAAPERPGMQQSAP